MSDTHPLGGHGTPGSGSSKVRKVGSKPSQNRPLYIAVLHIGERDRAVILDGFPDRNSCGLHALAGPTTHFAAALVFYASAL